MMLRTRTLGALAGAALLVAGLSGCSSQIHALAPVSGDDVASVRTAATDVLLAQKVSILEAPVCSKTETVISCAGSTIDGSAISVQSPLDGTMTVSVGSRTLFTGSVQEVLDRAAGGAQ